MFNAPQVLAHANKTPTHHAHSVTQYGMTSPLQAAVFTHHRYLIKKTKSKSGLALNGIYYHENGDEWRKVVVKSTVVP